MKKLAFAAAILLALWGAANVHVMHAGWRVALAPKESITLRNTWIDLEDLTLVQALRSPGPVRDYWLKNYCYPEASRKVKGFKDRLSGTRE